MRKPRDTSAPLSRAYDAELKALDDKARKLREQRLRQLGELVIASGADTLTAEELAGALIAAAQANAATKEVWRRSGAALFQRAPRTARHAGSEPDGTLPLGSTPPSA